MTRRALLSVYDKTGLVAFAQSLIELGFELLASGGTARLLADAGIPTLTIEDVTGFAEILGGRVKTLHPHIHGGILARDTEAHRQELSNGSITAIDLVVCNLYPFSQTIAQTTMTDQEAIEKEAVEQEAVEQIDIGGVTLLRAAAKNFERVGVVCDPSLYTTVITWLTQDEWTKERRRTLALHAFRHTASYDAAIATWLGQQVEPGLPAMIHLSARRVQTLRYGENPHQQAAWYRYEAAKPAFKLLQGKALSYNNLVDVTAAWQMLAELNEPCVAIVKHTNPCGMALGRDPLQAFERALACDPTSAFGSIIACNRTLTLPFAQQLGRLFVEVLVAPAITDEALAHLARKKKNCRVLIANVVESDGQHTTVLRSTQDGLLVQTRDTATTPQDSWQTATALPPNAQQHADLVFAWQVVKHVKSNAIVVVKDGATVGIGTGQTSRVGAVKLATEQAGEKCVGAVMASDAFFPFADGVEVAAAAGVTAVIQPGGSKRDPEVVAAADRLNVTMLMTGARHFRH